MNALVMGVAASSTVFALVSVLRAVSCARFNRALRSYVSPDVGHPSAEAIAPEGRSVVVDARRRFERRTNEAPVARPRSA
jgi:hypothetical protein